MKIQKINERERIMKHTKGKWEVKESDGVLTIVCTDLNNRKYYIGDVNGDADYEPTYRANANLIASAPEMYELLKRLSEDWEVDFKHQYDMIAVLAKAEGK